MKTAPDIMPNDLKPAILVIRHDVGINNDAEFDETGSPTLNGWLSPSTPGADHDASSDATDTTYLHDDDGNVTKEATGHVYQLLWPSIPIPDDESPHYNPVLEMEDEYADADESVLSGIGPSNMITTTAHVHRKCVTQPEGCVAVRVGWDSQIPRWCKGSELSYVVCEESFPTNDSANLVQDAMGKAIYAWKDTGARFKQVKRYEPATFAVIYDSSQEKDVYATAFFPKPSPGELRVCPLSFSEGNSKYLANILAHEIGHILGLRHEFALDKEAKCPSVHFGIENTQSVMDYYSDLSKLQVSQHDLEGLKLVYAYDQPMYMGLPVVEISPGLHNFSGRSTTNHATKKLQRRSSL